MAKSYSAVIADDHQIVRAGLRMALTQPGLIEENGIAVVGEAANGIEAIEQVKTHRPSVVLLDVSMPLATGAEILLDLKRWSPDTKIVVLTAVVSPGLLAGLVAAGVDGLFSKGSSDEDLIAKLPMILRGSQYVEPALATIIRDSVPMPALTPRERQTLNMIIAGKSNSELAALMGISPKTAEKHRASLMQKMEVKSVVELMSKALREGLIEQSDL
jgi:DNA-binding NarL/FixJ family response regulator